MQFRRMQARPSRVIGEKEDIYIYIYIKVESTYSTMTESGIRNRIIGANERRWDWKKQKKQQTKQKKKSDKGWLRYCEL